MNAWRYWLTLMFVLHAAGAAAESVLLPVPAGPRQVDGWPVILGNTMRHAPAIADIDGDGRDEIAIGIRDGRVFLLDGGGRPLPGWPREMDSWAYESPLLADVDGDGRFEVVAMSYEGFIYQWRIDGSLVPGWPVDLSAPPASSPQLILVGPRRERRILVALGSDKIFLLAPDGTNHPGWPKTIDQLTVAPTNDTHPTAGADLDGDGLPEILHLSSQEAFLHAWRTDGSTYPGFPRRVEGGLGLGIAIDRPTRPDRIACTTESKLTVFDDEGRLLYSLNPLDPDDRFMAPPYFISSGDSSNPDTDRIFAGTRLGKVFLWDRDGRLLPGWPVHLGGFIYGLKEEETAPTVYGPPLAADVDGDGAREIIIGCYNHHLYCLEFDGRLVPGWPETVEDGITGTMALAQLDGTGGKELIVGQIGETMFAFHMGPPPPVGIEIVRRAVNDLASREWPPAYYAAAAAIALMAFLIVRHLELEHARAGGWNIDWWTRAVLIAVLIMMAVRTAFFLADVRRYDRAEDRLASAEGIALRVLANERSEIGRTADELAAELDSESADGTKTPFELLAPAERLADHYRLDFRFKGVLVTDAAGDPIVGIGLARGWTDLSDLGIGPGGAADPILLGQTPAFVVESSRGIGAGPDSLRFFLFSSLLGAIPEAVADATGFSAYLRLEDRTLAWGGAALLPSPGSRPRLDRTQPSRNIAIPSAPGRPRLSIHLAIENFDRESSGWMDIIVVLIAPLLYLFLSIRRASFDRVRLDWWWILLFAALYTTGAIIFRTAVAETGRVSLTGRSLEVVLHATGMLGFAVIASNIVYSRRSKQLNIALLGSYLLVGLIPLTVVLAVVGNLIQDVQYRIVQNAITELVDRADNLAISYMGKYEFSHQLDKTGRELLSQPPETRWFNFVAEDHFLFTYDLPTSFLTLQAFDRKNPDRYFTGYSYRALRKDKLYAKVPDWMGEENQKGLFLDSGAPVIRALHVFRSGEFEARIMGHIPLDRETLGGIEKRLRIFPFLPFIRLESTWPEPPRGRGRDAGRYIPFSTDIILHARDWNTGVPRWISYRARAYLPPGREKWGIVIPALLLLLLPLGLSAWGAYFTFQRTVQPLTRLLSGIRRVEQGDLEYRLRDTGQSQVALAAQSFDKMAESLERKIYELAEKKKVEEVSALKSAFISMVSHDLKTPLASIKGAAENIIEELVGPVSERQRAYLEVILKSSENLQRMISDILDLSRIESGHLSLNMETLDIQLEVEHILRSIRPLLDEKRLQLRITIAAKGRKVVADRTRLWQIVNNIMSNAIRYSPPGGRIDVLIDDSPGGEGGGHPMRRITIIDQGPGITEDEEPRLFEPFFTRPSKAPGEHGAGLGLAIVKQLVELHGGTVSLKKAPDGGTSFTFTLPAKSPG